MTTTITATADQANRKVHLRVVTDTVGATTADIRRYSNGRYKLVRGGQDGDITSGVWVMDDWEFLFNTDLRYEVRVFDSSGDLLDLVVATPDVSITGTSAWLMDVLIPAQAMRVRLVGRDSGVSSTGTRRSLLRPLGRSAPVVLTDVRSAASGTIELYTATQSESVSLNNLIGSGNVLMFTGPAEFDLTWPLYVVFGTVSTARISDALDEARLRTCDWQQVDPPPGVVSPDPQTWQDLLDASTVWSDIDTEQQWVDITYPVTP